MLPGEAEPRRTTTTTTNRYLGAMGCRVKGTSVGFYWFLIIVLSLSLSRALEYTSGCLSLSRGRRLAGDAWIILAYLRRVDAMAPKRGEKRVASVRKRRYHDALTSMLTEDSTFEAPLNAPIPRAEKPLKTQPPFPRIITNSAWRVSSRAHSS